MYLLRLARKTKEAPEAAASSCFHAVSEYSGFARRSPGERNILTEQWFPWQDPRHSKAWSEPETSRRFPCARFYPAEVYHSSI